MTTNVLIAILVGVVACVGAVLATWIRTRIAGVIREFRGRLGNIEGRLGNIEGRLGNIEGRLGNVEGRQGNVEGRLESAIIRQGNVEERLVNLRRATARDYVEKLLPRPISSRRSVLFLHYNYYHFLYLAQALRRRGWDAFAVSVYPPDYVDRWLLHGEDVSLFSYDADELDARLHALHGLIQDRFRMVHFAGVGHMSLFAENFDQTFKPEGQISWDFEALKAMGIKIGYSTSGCNDGVRQSAFKRHKNACAKCIWELHPNACSDERNAVWGEKARFRM